MKRQLIELLKDINEERKVVFLQKPKCKHGPEYQLFFSREQSLGNIAARIELILNGE